MVHPTFWLKSVVWMARPFISSKFWRKLVYIRTLDDLYRIIPVEKAAVPEKVKIYDRKHSQKNTHHKTNKRIYHRIAGFISSHLNKESICIIFPCFIIKKTVIMECVREFVFWANFELLKSYIYVTKKKILPQSKSKQKRKGKENVSVIKENWISSNHSELIKCTKCTV